MSFILDALKKAEAERSRNSGPVLMDVRVAPPRRHLPTWAWVLGLVLLANLGVLGWLLLRKPAAPQAPAANAAPAPAPAAAAPAAAAPSAPAATPAVMPAGADAASLPESVGNTPEADLPATPAPLASAYASLPTLQDLAVAGTALPPLQLNLHVYDPAPTHRYILLNGARLVEGDFTPDGIKVEAITPQGVVLEAAGRRFRLPAGG